MASRPTTTASTPRPSANAAPMMNVALIWAAASGLRPMAAVDKPVRMPMPMPGPITPSAARPAPRSPMLPSMLLCSPPSRPISDRAMWAASVGRRDRCAGHIRRDVAFWNVVRLVLVVALDGDDSEHQGQHREDQCLHEVQQHLESDHGRGDDHDRQAGDDAQGNLAAVDVAEESHRQCDRLDELEQKLDHAHEESNQAG